MSRLEFQDGAGRPRLVAETFLRRGGLELSIGVIDHQRRVRLTANLTVHHQRGTVGIAVAVLDRHGTARLAVAIFLREDGSADVYFWFCNSIGLHAVFETPTPLQRSPFPDLGCWRHLPRQAVVLAVAQPRVDVHDGRLLRRLQRQAAALVLARLRADGDNVGGLRRLQYQAAALVRLTANLVVHHQRGTAGIAVAIFLREDGSADVYIWVCNSIRLHAVFATPAPTQRSPFPDLGCWRHLPRQAVVLAVAQPRVDVPDGRLLRRLQRQAAALVLARLHADGDNVGGLRRLQHEAAPLVRLTAYLTVHHQRGTVGIAVAVLDRHGSARLAVAIFLREDGSALVLERLRADVDNDGALRRLQRQAAALILALLRTDDANNGRGLALAWPCGDADNGRRLPHFLAFARPRADAENGLPHLLALARPRDFAHNGRHVLHGGLRLLAPSGGVVPAPTLGLARPHGDMQPDADLARGLVEAWRQMVVAAGLDHQARRHRGFIPAAALVVGEPLLDLPPAAARRLPQLPQYPRLAAAALGVHELAPQFHLLAAALGFDGPPRVASHGPLLRPAAAELGRAPPHPVDPAAASGDELLRLMEEGFAPPQRLQTTQRVDTILDEILTLTESDQISLINQWVNQASDSARRRVGLIPGLSLSDQQDACQDPGLSLSDQQDACQAQANLKERMWKSFVATVGLSIASNIFLYLLYAGKKLLAKNEDVGSSTTEAASYEGSRWEQEFLEWVVERFLSPAALLWLLIVVNLSVIDRERQRLWFHHNGITNILINSLSRGFFLGIRSYPGLQYAELWARIASVIIDILGAAFLYWMGGHWDPDIADG